MRVCIDNRALNNATIRDSYPLPIIEDFIYRLRNASVFTIKDAADGYFLVNMAEKDKNLTVFITEWGLFEFIVMSFGLTNASATFQRKMNQILSKELGQICIVYHDDKTVFSKDM